MYDHGHLTRAVSGRVTDDLDALYPAGYQSSYPYVGRVSAYDLKMARQEPAIVSVNWSQGDAKLEMVDGTVGRSTELWVIAHLSQMCLS